MPDLMKLEEIIRWLRKVSHYPIVEAVPVKVTLDGKHEFYGVRYGREMTYVFTERAVTEKRAVAGEKYIDWHIYVLGERPKFRQTHVCYTWLNDLPVDERVEKSNGEWYCSTWADQSHVRKRPDISPFGEMFMLVQHLVAVYGPYQDHVIDTMDPIKYQRVPMTVEAAG